MARRLLNLGKLLTANSVAMSSATKQSISMQTSRSFLNSATAGCVQSSAGMFGRQSVQIASLQAWQASQVARSQLRAAPMTWPRTFFSQSPARRQFLDFPKRDNSYFSSYGYGYSRGPSPQTALYGLIAANAAAFFAWQTDPQFMARHFTVSLQGIREGRLYTVVTSAFSHMTFQVWSFGSGCLVAFQSACSKPASSCRMTMIIQCHVLCIVEMWCCVPVKHEFL